MPRVRMKESKARKEALLRLRSAILFSSQRDIAEHLKVSPSYVNEVIKGRKPIPITWFPSLGISLIYEMEKKWKTPFPKRKRKK